MLPLAARRDELTLRAFGKALNDIERMRVDPSAPSRLVTRVLAARFEQARAGGARMSWCARVRPALERYGLEQYWREGALDCTLKDWKEKCGRAVLARERKEFAAAVDASDSLHRSLYAQLKHAPFAEEYTSSSSNRMGRSLKILMRAGALPLMEQLGARTGQPTDALCRLCQRDGITAVESAQHFVMECGAFGPLRAELMARVRASLLSSTDVKAPVPALVRWLEDARTSPLHRFLFLLGGDMHRFRPLVDVNAPDAKEQGLLFPSPDLSAVAGIPPAPCVPPSPRVSVPVVFGPAPPPRGVRSSPEWRLYHAMVRSDVRSIVDRHARNFLLIAWRLRDRSLAGRYRLEYAHAHADAAPAPAPAHAPSSPSAHAAPAPSVRSPPQSPPSPLPEIESDNDSDVKAAGVVVRPVRAAGRARPRPRPLSAVVPAAAAASSSGVAASASALASSAVAARLQSTLSVFDPSFPVWGGLSVQSAAEGSRPSPVAVPRGGRSVSMSGFTRMVFCAHDRPVGRASECARFRSGIRAV